MKQEAPMDLWVYEREAFDAGIKLVCGVDEAGRGPLAGPVCAAAVILPPGLEIPGLNDSKKLTDKKRRELTQNLPGNESPVRKCSLSFPQSRRVPARSVPPDCC